MGWITEWDSFQTAVQAMYAANPAKVRINVNYNHSNGTLVVRASDGAFTTCFKTGEAGELRLVDRLTQWVANEITNPAATVREAQVAAYAKAEVEKTTRRAARSKAAGERASTRVEKARGVPLASIRHAQKVAKKRATKWERRQERKLVTAAGAGSK